MRFTPPRFAKTAAEFARVPFSPIYDAPVPLQAVIRMVQDAERLNVLDEYYFVREPADADGPSTTAAAS